MRPGQKYIMTMHRITISMYGIIPPKIWFSVTCEGDTPFGCSGGQWVAKPACGGDNPVCSNGVCAKARAFGRISSVRDGVLAPAAGGIRLVDHGFEYTPRSCGTLSGCENGSENCFSGAAMALKRAIRFKMCEG